MMIKYYTFNSNFFFDFLKFNFDHLNLFFRIFFLISTCFLAFLNTIFLIRLLVSSLVCNLIIFSSEHCQIYALISMGFISCFYCTTPHCHLGFSVMAGDKHYLCPPDWTGSSPGWFVVALSGYDG